MHPKSSPHPRLPLPAPGCPVAGECHGEGQVPSRAPSEDCVLPVPGQHCVDAASSPFSCLDPHLLAPSPCVLGGFTGVGHLVISGKTSVRYSETSYIWKDISVPILHGLIEHC